LEKCLNGRKPGQSLKMAKTIGIGVIGMGWMGQVHSRSYRTLGDRFWDSDTQSQLIICADEMKNRAHEAKQRFGFAKATTDWRQVIAHPDVDVVNIATPNDQHVEIVKECAAAGKHIFCEKPVGRSPRETALIEGTARKAGVLSFVGYNYRWAPLVQYTRQLILDGQLGDLTHYRGRFLVGYASNPDGVLSWRFQHEHAGLGVLGDLMSHVIDMAHYLAGPIDRIVSNQATFIQERPIPPAGEGTHFSINAGGPKDKVTNEDYASTLVQFSNGAHGTFEVDRIISGLKCQMAFELHGTKGAIRWDFERMNELEIFLPDKNLAHDGFVTIASAPEHPSHQRFNPGPALSLGYDDLKAIEASKFLESIGEGTQCEPGFAQALAVAEVQDAIMRSWKSDSWESIRHLRL